MIGLLCDESGVPISVEVFTGNTQDTCTFASQIKKVAERFGGGEVTFVGDRGMIKSEQVKELGTHGFHYITAITKPQIETVLKGGLIQMDLFDQGLAEGLELGAGLGRLGRVREALDQVVEVLGALRRGVYASTALIAVLSFIYIYFTIGTGFLGVWGALIVGLVAGNVIGYFTEYYTSDSYKPTRSLADQTLTGPATLIIGGLSLALNRAYVVHWGLALAAFMGYALFAIGLALAVGSFARSTLQLSMWSVVLILLLVIPQLFYKESNLKAGIRMVLTWFPSSALASLFRFSCSTDVTSAQLWPNLAIAVVSIGIVFGLVVWKVRRSDQ